MFPQLANVTSKWHLYKTKLMTAPARNYALIIRYYPRVSADKHVIIIIPTVAIRNVEKWKDTERISVNRIAYLVFAICITYVETIISGRTLRANTVVLTKYSHAVVEASDQSDLFLIILWKKVWVYIVSYNTVL